jgi:vanillin dehydrogenase
MASSKVIVEAPLFDEFWDRFTAKAAAIRVGDPRDPRTVVGPLIRQSQCGFIDGQIREATEAGARLLIGGTHRDGSTSRPFLPV